MSLIFAEGFAVNKGATQLGRKWTTASGTVDTTGSGYEGGIALQSTNATLITPEFTEQAEWVLGFSLGFVSRVASVSTKITFRRNSGAEQVALHVTMDEDGNVFYLDLKRDTTLIESMGPFFSRDVTYFEFKCDFHPTTGSYELKANGVSIASDTGVNTANTTAAGMDSVKFEFSSAGGTAKIGDIYLLDDQGTLVDFLDPVRVIGIRPTADGAESDWAPSTGSDHYALVDDAAGTPDDNSRVTSYTASDEDLYEFGDLSIPAGTTIHGVILESVVRMEASGTKTVTARYRESGGSKDSGESAVLASTAWEWFSSVWEEEPIATTPWTVALVDAAQFGILLE